MARTSLAVLILSLFAVMLSPSPAQACTCMAGIPLCESAWTSDVVFSGEVLSVEPPTDPDGERLLPNRRVRIRVIEAWRGDVSGVVEVTTGNGGGDCGYAFLPKTTYLVYANARGGALRTGICTRTRPLSQAGEDLAYLKTAMNPSAAGKIFGTVQYQQQLDAATGQFSKHLIAGYPVTLSDGIQTWKAVSDADGQFEFTVPAGTYSITLTTPDTERAHGPRQVTLPDSRGCAAANFYVSKGAFRLSAFSFRLSAFGLPAPDLRPTTHDLRTTNHEPRTTNHELASLSLSQ
jgi:hypothetical protein